MTLIRMEAVSEASVMEMEMEAQDIEEVRSARER